MRFLVIFLLITTMGYSQEIKTPLEINDYSKVTSYKELVQYLNKIEKASRIVKVDSIGKSVEGRNIFVIKLSSGEFGKSKAKTKIMLMAQQHGNEQSGKEGALLLAKELIKPENSYLFNKLDIAIIPQVNPDGSEGNKRRNGNRIDLNRSHLTLLEPELIGLHRFFDKYLFEVTMDIHEYYPYGEESEKFGFRRNFDEQLGIPTNINVSSAIRDLAENKFIPFQQKYLNDRNVSFFIYSPGGPPDNGYVRHSTFDINDGRQSFAIQNTFSFIQEGLNGKDNLVDNIKHRSESQMDGMMGLIVFTYNNQNDIQKLVSKERYKLTNPQINDKVSIQLAHSPNGTSLLMPLLCYKTGKDSVFTITDYRPVVKSLFDVTKPVGYLIPINLVEIVDWVQRHQIKKENLVNPKNYKFEKYLISKIDSIDFEGENVANPSYENISIQQPLSLSDYIFVPTNQIKGNLLVIGLEPKSMVGLHTYKNFRGLIKENSQYPIIRVIRKK